MQSSPEHEWLTQHMARCPDSASRAMREVEHVCSPIRAVCSMPLQQQCLGQAMGEVLSPTYGTVVCVKPEEGIITIYLARDDIHRIFAPQTGTIIDIVWCQGQFYRPELVFVADQHKDGRAIILMHGEDDTTPCVEFWLEVGHKSYITDRVKLNVDVGSELKAGQDIGEILLGSLAEVHLPVGPTSSATDDSDEGQQQHRWKYLVQPGQRVVGGETVLAQWVC